MKHPEPEGGWKPMDKAISDHFEWLMKNLETKNANQKESLESIRKLAKEASDEIDIQCKGMSKIDKIWAIEFIRKVGVLSEKI